MKKILFTLLFLILAAPLGAQVLSNPTSNPTGSPTGWTRLHWVPGINKILVAYGYGSNPSGNNSVQLYDPLANSWATLHANDSGATGARNRDNHLSIYNSNLDQFWVYGGTFPAGTFTGRSGRFGPITAAPTWLATSTTDAGSFTGVIKNFGGGGSDSGVAWSQGCNCGVIFSGGDSALRRMWIIEPNVGGGKCGTSGGGSEPYNMCELAESGVWPDGLRSQCEGCLTSDANGNFYLVGGSLDISNHYNRTYKWNYTTGVWTELAAVPVAGWTSVVTYDSDLNLLLSRGDSFLAVYNVATNVWAQFNSMATDVCIWSPAGVYAPSVGKHIYQWGQQCNTGSGLAPAFSGVSLSGASLFGSLLLKPGLWTFRSFGPLPGGFPGKDSGSAKHMSMALNRTNGRFYNIGGDWGVTDGNPLSAPSPFGAGETARNEIWSFDPVANTAVLELPFCNGGKGDVTVPRPTEWGAVWDGVAIWALPGYSGNGNPTSFGDYRAGLPPPDANPYAWPCNVSTQALPVNAILKFNVTTKKFSQPSMPTSPCCSGGQLPKNGRYDEANHSYWRIGMNASSIMIEQYFIASNTWASYGLVCAADPHGLGTAQGCGAGNAYVNDVDFGFEHFALDPVGRKIYVIDPRHYRIIIIDMATCTNGGGCGARIGARPPNVNPNFISCLAYPDNTGTNTCPGGKTLTDWTQLNWDSVNGKVLYPFLPTPAPPEGCNPSTKACEDGLSGYPQLIVYDPVQDSWSQDASLTDTGARIRGNSFAFDPDRNFLLSIGGCIPDGCEDHSPGMNGYWLYRKGGTSPVNSTSTLTVNHMNLGSGVAITVTPNDNNGQGSGTTSFSRTFTIANATPVTLIAPPTAGGGPNPFSDWTGCDSRTTTNVANDTCHVIMASSKTVTAVYTTALVTRTLTVTSTPTGIAMTILPLDNNSAGDCPATPCTRVYNNGTAVTVTAPLTATLSSVVNSYTIWTGNCTSLNGRICSVTMSANKTVTAPYVSGTTYRNPVDFSNEQGQRGWSYRDSTGTLMTFGNGQWSGSEVPSGIGAGDLMHPGPTRTAVRRWTSPGTADLKITGNIRDVDSGGGDGVLVSIVKNGSTVLFGPSIIANGDTVGLNVDVLVTVANGDTIDTIVAARANSDFDTTLADLLIAPVVVAPAVATVKFGSSGPAVSFGAGAKFGQ